MTTTIRRLPAVVLLVVLALLPLQAWVGARTERLVVRPEADGLRSATWVASVAPDGRLSVRITYDLDDRAEREIDVRVPDGARYVAVNGTPVVTDIGLYATVPVRGPATITYELPGRVTRFEDGAMLRLLEVGESYLDGDGALFPCPRCYIDGVGYGDIAVDGALHLAGAAEEVEMLFTGLDPIRAGADAGSVRFVGVDEGADAVALVARLPSAAAPDLAITPGSVDDAIDEARTAARTVGEKLRAPGAGRAGARVTASILTAMLLALVAWIAWRLAAARRDRRAADDGSPTRVGVDAVYSPPSDLEPALAGLVVGEAGPGDRSVVAGTLLELARRGVISIDGVDSKRFVLTVPVGARGTTVFEEAVLALLRPQGQLTASATFSGPPLWGDDGRRAARRLRRVLLLEGMKRRLVRLTLSGLVLLPASIAMGVVALVASGGLSALGWFAVFAGPVLALVAALLSGLTLTAKGHDERRRWIAYADWLRSNTQLAHVGAPAVATWGEVLPHAAALGAAPVAARALSPRDGA